MEKVTVSRDVVIQVINYLAEQKFKDVAGVFLALEKEVIPQLQVQSQKLEE